MAGPSEASTGNDVKLLTPLYGQKSNTFRSNNEWGHAHNGKLDCTPFYVVRDLGLMAPHGVNIGSARLP